MDEKTARKYRSLGALPSTLKQPRSYRTRKDPLAALWQRVQARLVAEPRLRAKTLFDWLQREHPGQLTQSHRRTLERRVQQWRATAGGSRPVMFSQVHHAGDLAASDFTSMNSLGVTILGKRFEHLAYHFVLTYSNWESVTLSPRSRSRPCPTVCRTHCGNSGERRAGIVLHPGDDLGGPSGRAQRLRVGGHGDALGGGRPDQQALERA